MSLKKEGSEMTEDQSLSSLPRCHRRRVVISRDDDSDEDLPLIRQRRTLHNNNNNSPRTSASQKAEEKPEAPFDDSSISLLSHIAGSSRGSILVEKRDNCILIGVWKGSREVLDEEKDAVYAHISKNNALLCTVYSYKQDGTPIPGEKHPDAALNIRFERVLLDNHLVSLTVDEIRMYVKSRLEDPKVYVTSQELDDARVQAAHSAKVQASLATLSTKVSSKKRTEKKRQQKLSMSPEILPEYMPGDPKVILGVWKHSKEGLDKNKHAVCGTLDDNGSLRIFGVKQTQDGRLIDGPRSVIGGAAFLLKLEDCVLDPRLKHHTVPEIEEYVRLCLRRGPKSSNTFQTSEDGLAMEACVNVLERHRDPIEATVLPQRDVRECGMSAKDDQSPKDGEDTLPRPETPGDNCKNQLAKKRKISDSTNSVSREPEDSGNAPNTKDLNSGTPRRDSQGKILYEGAVFARRSAPTSDEEFLGEKKIFFTIDGEDYVKIEVIKRLRI